MYMRARTARTEGPRPSILTERQPRTAKTCCFLLGLQGPLLALRVLEPPRPSGAPVLPGPSQAKGLGGPLPGPATSLLRPSQGGLPGFFGFSRQGFPRPLGLSGAFAAFVSVRDAVLINCGSQEVSLTSAPCGSTLPTPSCETNMQRATRVLRLTAYMVHSGNFSGMRRPTTHTSMQSREA